MEQLHRKKMFPAVANLGLLKYICFRNYKFINYDEIVYCYYYNIGITVKTLAIYILAIHIFTLTI